MAKLIHAASLAVFLKAYTGWASSNSDVYTSIAFTDDGYVCTHGINFRLMRADKDFPYAVSVSGTDGVLKVDVGGANGSITVSGKGLTVGGTASTLTLDHSTQTLYTKEGGYNTWKIYTPSITTDAYGHITAIDTVPIEPWKVYLTSTKANSEYNLVFNYNKSYLDGVYYSDTTVNPITYNPSTGVLTTPDLKIGSASISDYIRTIKADASNFGVVKLIDNIDANVAANNLGAASSIASSLLALYNVYKAAIDYTDKKLTSAISFKGTLGTNTTDTVAALPTEGYMIGDEYRISTAGTYAGKVCEVGDMIIAIKSYATGAVAADDWSVIQTNLVGALLTNGNPITKNALVMGADNSLVTNVVVPSQENSFLYWNGSAYAFTLNIYRPVYVNGNELLLDYNKNSIGFNNGTNTTVNYSSGVITIDAANTLYKLVSGKTTSTSNEANTDNAVIRLLTSGDVDSGTITLSGSGKTSINTTGGVITINSTWRPVSTYTLSTDRVLASIADSSLNFSTTFGLKANTTTNISEIDLAWAEVTEDAAGNVSVSYTI